jgi:hypothetical protein
MEKIAVVNQELGKDIPQSIDFRFGCDSLSLEVPPFFIDFDKNNFKSILVRKAKSPQEGVLFHIYVTRSLQMEKLLVLKSIHPDIFLPREIEVHIPERETLEVSGFIDSILKLEEIWPYEGNGVWFRNFGLFKLHMVLIIGKGRWTFRPTISKQGLEGFGVEIPVDAKLAEEFKQELRENELEEVHDHETNRHFHLKINNLKRYIELAKKWDYYFSTTENWQQTVRISRKNL